MRQKLRVENLRLGAVKSGQPLELVHGVNLEIERGQILALIGSSGSGKSLTCAGLQGVLPAGIEHLGGRAWIQDGEQQHAVRPGRDVATIMQHPRSAFDPLMTMRAHAQETARFASRPRKLSEEELRRCFAEAGLDDERVPDLYPFEMSGGMLQRAMMAVALILETPFILADEPTTAMDLVVQTKVLDMLKQIAQTRHIGMLFVTHDMGVVAHMATDVAVMDKGRIVETGTVQRIFDAPQHARTRALVQAHLALYPEEAAA
ncbi:MAG: ATP-binding cassette domain-containing protein [Brachymonas sp.]|nr:ATP-binding cassette domain-containing protein [Brachymonas sp.]